MPDDPQPVSSRSEGDALFRQLAAGLRKEKLWGSRRGESIQEHLDRLLRDIESRPELNAVFQRLKASPREHIERLPEPREEKKVAEFHQLVVALLPEDASLDEYIRAVDEVERERPDLDPEPALEDGMVTSLRTFVVLNT